MHRYFQRLRSRRCSTRGSPSAEGGLVGWRVWSRVVVGHVVWWLLDQIMAHVENWIARLPLRRLLVPVPDIDARVSSLEARVLSIR